MSRKRRPSAAASPRLLQREPDGELLDLDERRAVSIAELREDIRAGRRFRAKDRASGTDCTYAVLVQVMTGGRGSRSSEGPDTLSSLVRGTVGNVLEWAAEDPGATGGSRRSGGTRRARRSGRRRDSSSIGPG